MATVDQLQKMIERSQTKGKHPRLEVSPGIWIDADAFREMKGGIIFFRNGHTSGFVRRDIFEQIPWKITIENPKPKQED